MSQDKGKVAAEKPAAQAAEHEQDSFDRLSLAAMPLQDATLRTGHLIKNEQMETMLEIVKDELAGSLQIRPEEIADNFEISDADQELINKLSALGSYDVFSLRINLHKLGIHVDPSSLELSGDTKNKLLQYAQEFTRPLIVTIFADGEVGENENLQKLFRDPDRERVAQRLKTMSAKIGIPVGDIPTFLGAYNDLYMSGSYYRHTFEAIMQDVSRFYNWMAELKTHREVATSPRMLESFKKVEEAMHFLCTSVIERMTEFKGGFETFWKDMNMKSFEKLRRQVEDNRGGIGSVLCGLTVKMREWKRAFPTDNDGSPATRIKYLLEMKPFFDKLQSMENDARLLAVVWQ